MNKDIDLKPLNLDKLLLPKDSLFYGKRRLTREAEEFIKEEVEYLSLPDQINIRLFLSGQELERKHEITEAIHQHFNYLKQDSQKKLRQTLTRGWKAFGVALLFLLLIIFIVSVVDSSNTQGHFVLPIREVFIVIGWVALWRPVEFLLYEWRPFRREMKIFDKLANSVIDVKVSEE